ncbi:YolD-like family protein [Jeotgalibacillus proteolyticus]|uniref:YolD-like family protein n=1 Tax=Jeotgalibacillus proteolyticus TaxID=2082395 RepID=A0A2S5G9B9_9BACL|nr:YolD-like family protein [Jeotgalibacillus proteolyticus]PPA69569.1 YolD-like family protein [Jeotgalibacillus proteolyticus]
MIRDRGKIKWQPAMMLPEYSKLLKKANDDAEKIQKPVIDEQAFQEFEIRIYEAMEYSLLAQFSCFKDGRIHTIKGYVSFIDYNQKHFRIKNENHKVTILPFGELTDVQVLDEQIQHD